MEVIKSMFRVFTYVTVGITISAAIFLTIFAPGSVVPYYLLWQILCMAAVSAIGNLIYLSKKELSKHQMIFRSICHYLYINLVVLGGASLWGWFRVQAMQIIVMFSLLILVYAIITVITFRNEKCMAKNLNLRLSARDEEEEK